MMLHRIQIYRSRMASRLHVLQAAMRHPRTPRGAKVLLGAAVGYALLPFDLVPDWIPVLGQLDDVLIVGGLLWIGWMMVPDDVRRECRSATVVETP